MSNRIGMNVALGLNTGGFSKGLNKAKLDMDKFSKDIKRQNELMGKLGLGGLGRGFGIAGGAMEAISMGGIGGLAAAVALPLAAISGTIALLDGINQFRRDAAKHLEQVKKDVAEGKAAEVITDQMSAFALMAAKQKAVAGPGAFETFKQSVASARGGQDLTLATKGMAAAFGELVTMAVEDPRNINPAFLFANQGLDRLFASGQVGVAQNTGQAQTSVAVLEETRRQTTLLDRMQSMLGGN